MSSQAKQQSAMFRAIVMMGSGLALSCGAVAQEDPSSNTGGGGGSAGNSAAAGSNNSGTGGITGVSGSGFAGNSISLGGSLIVGSGGSAGTGGARAAGGAPPADCPPSQWLCAGGDGCSYDTGWSLENCKCDPSRPKSAASCAAGEAFTCLSTTYGSDKPYGFECSCIPSMAGCTCNQVFGPQAQNRGPLECDVGSVPDTTLCGCAVVVLK
jgi:hypothetical protein